MPDRAAICVIEPGMFTTVQDLGRTGWGAVGVARGGAADALSLRAGNRLVGNQDGAAALEMTMTGGTFEFTRDAYVVLTGGKTAATIEPGNTARPVDTWAPTEIRAGQRLQTGPIQTGVRTYLCVAGGVAVAPLLGSRSTHLGGGFGGLCGRPLRSGDIIDLGDAPPRRVEAALAERVRTICQSILARRTLRAVDGAHQPTFDAATLDEFWATEFKVSVQSDRTGVRLSGRVGPSSLGGRMPSEAMMIGAVQVPESGAPIVLLVDHPTTGGYPVIACVAAVDHAVLGQLRPREALRFEHVTREAARALFAEQQRQFDAQAPPT